ncbi:PREDICTED: vesicular, overexpressed in cancer, prosurvival protein 1-like [Branchiostoma belcheri]|uniref:WW domain binding protein VOPP1 n=1 Tax=Branchiostoma belcheri TaxID=7741 RepID=A0A6P4ZEE5_BRABE|nr:PREDICTED: vesicular, overexpressed in cancer, prosurvival protein 1-like [Branchiostoma belcheri]
MATAAGFFALAIIAGGFSEVHGRYCYADYNNGQGQYFNCHQGEYCCGTKCCINTAGAFYSLWYFWLIVLMGIILCSSGGFWYRRRYYQQRIVTTIERQGQNGFVARTTHTMEELPSSTDSYCGPRAVAISQSATTANVPNVPVYPVKYTITHTGPYPYPYPYPMPPPNGPPPPYTQAVIGPQAAGNLPPAPPGVVTENCSSSATNTTTNTTILSG